MALCSAFADKGWYVVATDRRPTCPARLDAYVQGDLHSSCANEHLPSETLALLNDVCLPSPIRALVKNAGGQIIGKVVNLTGIDWHTTVSANLLAPYLLIQGLLEVLTMAKGSVANIASIHGRLTKPEFSLYVTRKAVIVGLTRTLAVELGSRVRVNATCPGAISASMLIDALVGRDDGFRQLQGVHPIGTIGSVGEVVKAALFLCADDAPSPNPCILGVDGGIGSRLHNPV